MGNTSINIIIGCCGIVCSECESFISSTCKGCRKQEVTDNNCPIMECCMEHKISTCAECSVFLEYGKCDKLSDVKNLKLIKEIGLEEFLSQYKKHPH